MVCKIRDCVNTVISLLNFVEHCLLSSALKDKADTFKGGANNS